MKNFINKTLPAFYWLVLATLCFVFSILLGLKVGFWEIGLTEVFYVIAAKLFGVVVADFDSNVAEIIWNLRLPRSLLAGCVGMGLTLSGIIMQAIVRNPLADPYILGVSSGASLGATVAIFCGLGSLWGSQVIGLAAFSGAFLVSLLVIFISDFTGPSNSLKLLLSGMALSAVCSGFSSYIVYWGKNKEGMEAITFWLMGNVANAKLENVVLLFIVIILAVIFFATQSRVLNLMLVGQNDALTLGIDLQKHVKIYLLINGLIVGFVVLNAGTIGFVGLIVPHICRMLFGVNHKNMLLVAVLIGGCIAVWADIISRTLLQGVEIPLGVIFALLGAPTFIYLLLKKNYNFGGN